MVYCLGGRYHGLLISSVRPRIASYIWAGILLFLRYPGSTNVGLLLLFSAFLLSRSDFVSWISGLFVFSWADFCVLDLRLEIGVAVMLCGLLSPLFGPCWVRSQSGHGIPMDGLHTACWDFLVLVVLCFFASARAGLRRGLELMWMDCFLAAVNYTLLVNDLLEICYSL